MMIVSDQVPHGWSLGTRVSRRIDGRWKMIRRHVPFTYNSETGQAKTDLKPPQICSQRDGLRRSSQTPQCLAQI